MVDIHLMESFFAGNLNRLNVLYLTNQFLKMVMQTGLINYQKDFRNLITKMKKVRVFMKFFEIKIYNIRKYRRKKRKPKFKIAESLRTSNLRNAFYKGDTLNCSYEI